MMRKTLASIAVLAITLGIAGNAAAQGQNVGNPEILNAVQELQKSLDALAAQVTTITGQETNITTQLTNIATQLTALNTAPTRVATGLSYKPAGYSAGCEATNVGTSSVTVKMELMRLDGTVQQFLQETAGPGSGVGFGQSIGSLADHFYCRFTLISGSSANIRASFSVVNEATGLTQVVREAR